jgi:hypothetical protein
MGHPHGAEDARMTGHQFLYLIETVLLRVEVSHPFRDETAKWMGTLMVLKIQG